MNQLFRQIMAEDLGGITYDDEAALYPGASFPESPDPETEVLVLEIPEKEEQEEARKMEARMIAGRIARLLAEGKVTDKETGELRRVKYSDIVILTRSIQGYADTFAEVLNQEGIRPTQAVKKDISDPGRSAFFWITCAYWITGSRIFLWPASLLRPSAVFCEERTGKDPERLPGPSVLSGGRLLRAGGKGRRNDPGET